MLAAMIDCTSQSSPNEPRVQAMTFHQGFAREVPHQEQALSSLPISRLQRGQSMALFAIEITPFLNNAPMSTVEAD
jgi:hypothetical protein